MKPNEVEEDDLLFEALSDWFESAPVDYLILDKYGKPRLVTVAQPQKDKPPS